jgi:hypothetical protein
MKAKPKDSCRELFKKLGILTPIYWLKICPFHALDENSENQDVYIFRHIK